MPWDKAKKTEGAVLKDYAISNGIASEKIFVTKDVENTADEAVAVKELISPSNRIILVTSAYHMYRAQRLFEKQGFEVIPYKVDYKTAGKSAITVMNFLPSAGNLEMTETGIRELLGRLFYLINDWKVFNKPSCVEFGSSFPIADLILALLTIYDSVNFVSLSVFKGNLR